MDNGHEGAHSSKKYLPSLRGPTQGASRAESDTGARTFLLIKCVKGQLLQCVGEWKREYRGMGGMKGILKREKEREGH